MQASYAEHAATTRALSELLLCMLCPLQVRNLGKPVELAGRYFAEGADEVTFLNITGAS